MRHKIYSQILWRMCAGAPQNCLRFCGALVRMRHRIPNFCGAPSAAPQNSNTSRMATVATASCATERGNGAPQLALFLLVQISFHVGCLPFGLALLAPRSCFIIAQSRPSRYAPLIVNMPRLSGNYATKSSSCLVNGLIWTIA
jgi:hypothetical protein